MPETSTRAVGCVTEKASEMLKMYNHRSTMGYFVLSITCDKFY
jgi:hypothetical protein